MSFYFFLNSQLIQLRSLTTIERTQACLFRTRVAGYDQGGFVSGNAEICLQSQAATDRKRSFIHSTLTKLTYSRCSLLVVVFSENDPSSVAVLVSL